MVTDHYEGEDVIITLEEEGKDNAYNYEGRITNISTGGGAADVETVRCFGGKSITLQKPSGDYEIRFDIVLRDNTFAQVLFGGGASGKAGTSEISSGSESSKNRWRVVVWFLGDGATASTSGAVVVPSKTGELMRWIYKDCHSVTFEEEFSAEDYLKGSLTLKCGATDENGSANVYKQWTSDYSGTALATMTTQHGGTLTWNATTPAWTASYRT